MQQFDHLLTTRPHDISTVFVSDLHLSSDTPALNQAFLALIKDLYVLPNLQSLYILGDWLDGWIGDDDYLTLSDDKKARHFLTPILNTLKTLSTKTAIYIMHGNRDFTIRQSLCDTFHGTLIKEPHFLTLSNGIIIRLEHGDRLCTDDKAYQRYRKIIQNPVISWLIFKTAVSLPPTPCPKNQSQISQRQTPKTYHYHGRKLRYGRQNHENVRYPATRTHAPSCRAYVGRQKTHGTWRLAVYR